MRAQREVILSVLCLALVACGAATAGPDASVDATIEGVGILPGSNPDAAVIPTDPATTVAATELPTTTLAPLPQIGTLVTGNKLLMIGDSITASAAKRYGGELCDALVPLGWQVEVDAEPSRFVDFGNDVLDTRLAAKWDAAYVFLGTNYLGDQLAYRKQLEKIVERLSPSPVVLLTVTLFEDSRQEVNDAITLVGAEFPNVRVIDWGSIAAADATTILRGDGHHLTNDGRLVLASTVAGVLGQAPGEPGKCLSTSFSNDSGASVNGSDDPPQRPVGSTPTATTVAAGGGGGSPTTTPPTQPPSNNPNPTAPPGITAVPPPAATTPPPTTPVVTRPRTPPTTAAAPPGT
jgi:hypothetical protein